MMTAKYSKILGKRLKIGKRTGLGRLQYLTLRGTIKEWIDADLLREYIDEIFEFEERTKRLKKVPVGKFDDFGDDHDDESRRSKRRSKRKRHWSSSLSYSADERSLSSGFNTSNLKFNRPNPADSTYSDIRDTKWNIKAEDSIPKKSKFQLNLGRKTAPGGNPHIRERSRKDRRDQRYMKEYARGGRGRINGRKRYDFGTSSSEDSDSSSSGGDYYGRNRNSYYDDEDSDSQDSIE